MARTTHLVKILPRRRQRQTISVFCMIKTEIRKPIVQDLNALNLLLGKSNVMKLVGLVEMMWLRQNPREVWSLKAPESKSGKN